MSRYLSPRPPMKTLVKRARSLPNDGSRTLFFHAPRFGKSGAFFSPQDVEDFEGEEAEFEYTRAGGRVVLGRLVRVTKP